MATSNITNLTNIKELSDLGAGGTRIGQSAADLVSFHGAAPVAQRAFTASIVTTAPVSVCGGAVFGWSTSAQVISVVTLLNEIHAIMKAKGFMASS